VEVTLKEGAKETVPLTLMAADPADPDKAKK